MFLFNISFEVLFCMAATISHLFFFVIFFPVVVSLLCCHWYTIFFLLSYGILFNLPKRWLLCITKAMHLDFLISSSFKWFALSSYFLGILFGISRRHSIFFNSNIISMVVAVFFLFPLCNEHLFFFLFAIFCNA